MVLGATFLESRALSNSSSTQAFSVPPSQVWDGNDGAWSTFVIRIGSPAQYFRVLPGVSSDETWVPAPDDCGKGIGWCGNPRGVEPFNAGTSGPASGSPSGLTLGSIDAGYSCTANKSPMCVNCVSIDGKCTNGPCVGRTCCGDPPGECNSGGCNGVSGLCTGAYIGCPCPGPDYNAATSATPAPSAINPLSAQGFLPNISTSWSNQGTHSIDVNLPVPVLGQYGLDTVGIGSDSSNGLTMKGSIVAGIPAFPYYLGRLGLKPSNTSGPTQGRQSLSTLLFSQGLIPSSSFGYSAGALYRPGPVFGSLTLGGFDNSRITPNGMTFAITDYNELRVPLQAITASETLQQNATILSKNITALIDTNSPHSWLPSSVCEAFETAFGLVWDNTTMYYLVNDSTHEQLLNKNPSITFSLGGDLARPVASSLPNELINITLPYGAFDLQAASPIYSNGTNYFPIRRASNDSQYTLGRAFFQEAYLIVDYEAGNFSISQAKFPTNSTPDIITINHHLPSSNASTASQAYRLSNGTIAGVAIGGCAAAFLICSILFIFFCGRERLCKFHHQEKRSNKSSSTYSEGSPKETTGWPETSTLYGMSSPDRDRVMGFSPTTMMTSPAFFTSPTTNELEDTWSTTKVAHAKGHGNLPGVYRSSIDKPLPKPPVELAGKEVASELMQRSRNPTPRGRRSRSRSERVTS